MCKKRITAFCCTLLYSLGLFTFILAEPVRAADPQYKFRLGHIVTAQNPIGQASTRLAEVAYDLSKGRIKVDVFDSAQLGGELDLVSQIRMGSLDLALIGSGMVASIEPTFSFTELPFIWKSYESARKVLDGPIGNKVLSMLEIKGIKGLAWAEWGLRGILNNKRPIEKPDDLKGLKIRVIENPLYITSLRTFGANPVPMAWPEIYTAMQQGTIDGVDTNYVGFFDAKHYEVGKYLAVTDHMYTPVVVLMNLKTFKSLPRDLQQVMLKAGKAGGERARELAKKANDDAIEFMAGRGIIVTRPARKPFEDKAQEVYKRFAAQIGQDLINEVIAAQK